MRILSIDVETYSDIDISKAGLYRYMESPIFEILLIAYAFDDEEPTVLDLTTMTEQEKESWRTQFKHWLADPDIRCDAYNAEFEINVFSTWFRERIPLDRWWDTMVTALTCGLPRSLKDVGNALGMPEDKAKLAEGKRLVTYFCTPCKPTKANGLRTRNTRLTDPEKWAKFIEYNRQDVVAERAIREKLKKYEPDESEHDAWMLSTEINRRGVMIDRQMAEMAVRITEQYNTIQIERMKQITGLENPNSNSQLASWLGIPSVAKDNVEEELKTAEGDRREVLLLRQEIGKTSVTKYEAMLSSVCDDDRVRGLFAFYGANRSGRFSSKLVQLQNLPQNHLSDRDSARQMVKEDDWESIDVLYGNVPDTLSQLIRTTFIAKPGYTFAVADFSAIEARVIAYMADEQWRMDLFARGGDIYCQSASQMFGVPVVKHGVNGHLRQKGKCAELGCIALNSLVLTDSGLIPIQDVTLDMKLWDGEEWVNHDGVIYKGEREVITYDGLTATPDHLVFVEGKSGPVRFDHAAASGAYLIKTGNDGDTVWLGENHQSGEAVAEELEQTLCPDPVSGVWRNPVAKSGKPDERRIKGLSGMLTEENDSFVAEQKTDICKTEVRKPERQGIQELRSKRDKVRLPECDDCGIVSGSGVWPIEQEDGAGQDRHERKLCTGESPTGRSQNKLCKPETKRAELLRSPVLAICPVSGHPEAVTGNDERRNHPGCREGSFRETEKLERYSGKVKVYDIRNAGRHHRFTVSGKLVHNCGYGGSSGALKNMGALKMGLTEEELPEIVQKWREASPNIVKLWWTLGDAMMNALLYKTVSHLKHGINVWRTNKMLIMQLPSGRCLRYFDPQIGLNRFGKESVTYMGYEAGKWSRLESYGPKFVENCIQGIARDCLVEAMKRVSKRYPDIVMHVHDEMIVEVPEAEAEEALKYITDCMAEPISWAPGMLLRGDGYITKYYKKD